MLHNIHQMLKDGRDAEAAKVVVDFLEEDMQLKIASLEFHQDNYSLNSVRGFIELEPGSAKDTSLFFKFHQEENEEATVKEYYQAHLLDKHGFPVDLPLHVSSRPGAQIVLYHRRDWARLSDVSRDIEHAGCPPERVAKIVKAQEDLDRIACGIYKSTLHPVTPEQVSATPVLQLFTWRLVEDGDLSRPGGRVKRFYEDSTFEFSGLDRPLDFAELCELRWEINGTRYQSTLGEAFAEARRLLTPENLSRSAGMAGHGDAHNANVWVVDRPLPERERGGAHPDRDGMGEGAFAAGEAAPSPALLRRSTPDQVRGRLSPVEGEVNAGPGLKYYDPAFASEDMPALLGEVKPLFHNIFAHPDWLYHPEDTPTWLKISARQEDGWLKVDHNWQLTPLREAYLKTKMETVIAPLLEACDRQDMLQDDWRQVMKAALFCCPTLVMNLTPNATSHTPETGLLGFAIAMMMASEPEIGHKDVLSAALDRPRVKDRALGLVS